MKTPPRLAFTKLEALGNDFMLIDARRADPKLNAERVRWLGDRRRGVGFDQLLVVHPASDPGESCRVAIYNSDGSVAEQCGNGMRALALWLSQRGEKVDHARVNTPAGGVELSCRDPDRITATIGIPGFGALPGAVTDWPLQLTLDQETLAAYPVELGNPHVVALTSHPVSENRLRRIAGIVRTHLGPDFDANIGLARPTGSDRVDLQVDERGAGPTPACGSGACAAAVVLISLGQVNSPVTIRQRGGACGTLGRQGAPGRVDRPGPMGV